MSNPSREELMILYQKELKRKEQNRQNQSNYRKQCKNVKTEIPIVVDRLNVIEESCGSLNNDVDKLFRFSQKQSKEINELKIQVARLLKIINNNVDNGILINL